MHIAKRAVRSFRLTASRARALVLAWSSAEKIARARSQLYREAIANFMQTDTPDPRTVAEDRRLVQQLQNHDEHWHRIARSAPRN